MNPKLRNLFLLLFLLGFIATIVVFFSSGKDMRSTWLLGGPTIILYLIYRFSRK